MYSGIIYIHFQDFWKKSLLFSHGLFTLLSIQLLQYDKWFSCSRIHSPWLGRKVGSGPGLSYRPAMLQRLHGRPVRQPFVGVNYIPPSRDYKFGYSSFVHSPLSSLPPPPQEKIPFIFTLGVPIHLSFKRQQGPPLSSLSGRESTKEFLSFVISKPLICFSRTQFLCQNYILIFTVRWWQKAMISSPARCIGISSLKGTLNTQWTRISVLYVVCSLTGNICKDN